MLHSLYKIDLSIFRTVNEDWASPWLDPIMLSLSSAWMWVPFAIILLWHLYRTHKWDWLRLCLVAVVLIGIADFVSYEFLKPTFSRLRPCKTWDFVRVVSGCGGWDSFPSNHATNTAAAAYVLWRYSRHAIGAAAILLCALVATSRVYLGVHYPSDVLVGALFGASFAAVGLKLVERHLTLPKPYRAHSSDEISKMKRGL